MTNVPEVYLAREAGICYCTIGLVTDYDCWLEDPSQHASLERVISRYGESLKQARRLLEAIIRDPNALASMECGCSQALAGAVLTPEHGLTPEKRELLRFLTG
jgi:5'-methylthioadenosine phosphorylase